MHEDAWFCVAAERADRVKRIAGGIGHILRERLKYICSSVGQSLQGAGILLKMYNGTSIRILAELRVILQDGGAHKQVFMVKGDSGLKICTECRSMYTERSGIVDEDNNDLLTCALVRSSEMDFATDDDVRGTLRRLAHIAATRTSGELKLRERERESMWLQPQHVQHVTRSCA